MCLTLQSSLKYNIISKANAYRYSKDRYPSQYVPKTKLSQTLRHLSKQRHSTKNKGTRRTERRQDTSTVQTGIAIIRVVVVVAVVIVVIIVAAAGRSGLRGGGSSESGRQLGDVGGTSGCDGNGGGHGAGCGGEVGG